jgi:hypothetical protein
MALVDTWALAAQTDDYVQLACTLRTHINVVQARLDV